MEDNEAIDILDREMEDDKYSDWFEVQIDRADHWADTMEDK